jgi:hypothetical protein
MDTRYEHMQPGYVILGATAGAGLFAAALLLRKVAAGKLLPGMFLLGAVGAVFSSLTIVITDEDLRASFGPGLTIKRVRLVEIESARTVRNPWYYGFGIRITPRGLLYNVSGLDAVEIRLRSGSTFRLGTDEPDRLLQALEAARAEAA